MQPSPLIPKEKGLIAGWLSRLVKPPSLLLAIIFFSSTQFGLHFWPSTALIYGIRIDYLSPTLYFLDCLILLFFVDRTVLKRNSRLQVEKGSAAAERTVLIGTITPALLVNLLYSSNPLATLSWSLHLLLYLAFILSLQLRPLQDTGRESKTSPITIALLAALLFQLGLAIVQVMSSHSLGGAMYYLGERSVSVGSPAIAIGEFMGRVVLRAYGTFSHPNTLAGWLIVSLLIILKLTPPKKLRIDNWLLLVPTTATIIGVLLTQSRAAALSLFGLVIPLFFLRPRFRPPYYLIVLLLCYFFYTPIFSPPRSELSSSQRLSLQRVSLGVIQKFPVFGTGAQASLSTYPATFSSHERGQPQFAQTNSGFRLLQPDHNSFTLLISWFGLFGLLALIYLVCYSTSRYTLVVVLPLLPLLLFDHYLLTSPQGLFTLLLYLKITSSLN